jgi:tetratricopeptide (TPR) repeat protein
MIADKLNPELNYRFQLYDSVQNAAAHKLKFHNLTHSYFSTLGILFQTRDKRQDKSDVEIMQSYKWVSEYVLNFLNANLKSGKASKLFIQNEPSANGVPEGLISMNSKQGTEMAFDFRNFNELALQHNYDNLFEHYQRTKEAHPELEIPEGALNNLGLQLVFNPEISDNGIKVFQFAVKLYPESANLYDSMAEGYLFIGNTEKAIESFELSLKLDSSNQNAIQRLKELKR